MPVYKTNMHLFKTVLSYLENNNMRHINKRLIQDLEGYAGGKLESPDITGYDRANYDKYNYSKYFSKSRL